MPVAWAIAQSDVEHLDRFTSRCRMPMDVIHRRPRWASGYVVYKPSDEPAAAYVCRATAVVRDNDHDHSDPERTANASVVAFDRLIKVNAPDRPALMRRLAADQREDMATTGCERQGMQWIPRQSISNAGGVTLEVDVTGLIAAGRGDLDGKTLLADTSYRQILHETMQHHLVVCKLATVHLPLPGSLRHSVLEGMDTTPGREKVTVQAQAHTLPCRVVSTYPAVDFVRVTPNTRVTITLPSPTEDENGAEEDTTAETVVVTTKPMASQSAPSEPVDHLPRAPRSQIGGLEKERQALREMILLPVQYASLRTRYEMEFPKGLLLCGPPGVGKTLLVRTVVEECRALVSLQLEVINGSEIMTSGTGDAEAALRSIFRRAGDHAQQTGGASVVFIDELDALCPARDAHGGGSMAHSRIVAQLLTLLDGVDEALAQANVIIVAATNLPNSIDPALRRPGRFDRELFLTPPDAAARARIFDVHMSDMPFALVRTDDEEQPPMEDARSKFIASLAAQAVGYVGADIAALCREALSVASTRQFVALTRNQELDDWWYEWKRHGQALQVSDLENMVARIAWNVNPVAIPLWFLQKPTIHPPTDASASASARGRPVEYFRHLFQGIHGRSDNGHAGHVAHKGESSPEPPVFEVYMEDFKQAMQVVVASSLRSASGVAKNVETLGWESIGGQDETKLALQQALEWPIKFPQTFSRLGVSPPRGILLYGPPGCSKSTIVRAAAHSSGATFLSLSAAQVFSPFFGDAEAAVRQVFRDARAALPAIIFFDEVDVLVTKRDFGGGGNGSDSGSGSTALRVLSTLLNEMDGVESAEGLLVIGATNRPDCIDAALLRPGRFDRILFVDLPTELDRLEILRIHTKNMTLHGDVDLEQIVEATPYFSGAELENVCREAALQALRESITAECVSMRHFVCAAAEITPVTTEQSLHRYFEFAAHMGSLT